MILQIDFWNNPAFWAGLLGGAVAALLIRFLAKGVAKILYCFRTINNYEPSGFVVDKAVSGKLTVKRCKLETGVKGDKFWRYSPDQKDKLGNMLYGPYTNDFGKPGYYRVRFKILASGFEKTNDPILRLEVVQGVKQYDIQREEHGNNSDSQDSGVTIESGISGGPVITSLSPYVVSDDQKSKSKSEGLRIGSYYVDQIQIAQTLVRSKKLNKNNGKFCNYDVDLYSSGGGIFEYRCWIENFDSEKHTVDFKDVKVNQFLPWTELFS